MQTKHTQQAHTTLTTAKVRVVAAHGYPTHCTLSVLWEAGGYFQLVLYGAAPLTHITSPTLFWLGLLSFHSTPMAHAASFQVLQIMSCLFVYLRTLSTFVWFRWYRMRKRIPWTEEDVREGGRSIFRDIIQKYLWMIRAKPQNFPMVANLHTKI